MLFEETWFLSVFIVFVLEGFCEMFNKFGGFYPLASRLVFLLYAKPNQLLLIRFDDFSRLDQYTRSKRLHLGFVRVFTLS